MILKGSQRGGGAQLAAHLMNDRDNDHVTVQELRGFMADDLDGALREAHAISKATRCKQFMFSLSINPPKEARVGVDELVSAADRAGETLGLQDQPRAIVVHEKNGRRHAHVVWSRIDPEAMKAVNLPFFKTRLAGLSKDLYLEHGWELPEGHRTNGWKNPLNFTLAEWQQAKRLDLDPREVKQVFQSAWARSDSAGAFRHALEEHGYYLARGDRRGVVALDLNGEVFSAARWAGVKTKALNERMGDIGKLPSVAERRAELQKLISSRLRAHVHGHREKQAEAEAPLAQELRAMIAAQRKERTVLEQKLAARSVLEAKVRAERLHKGIRGVWELLTGKARAIRRQNEGEAFAAHARDRKVREEIYQAQSVDRRKLAARMVALRARHKEERKALTAQVVTILREARRMARDRQEPHRNRDFGAEMELRR